MALPPLWFAIPNVRPHVPLAQGEAHAASAPHGLGNLRVLPFSWSCKTPSSTSGKNGRRRLTCAAMMHFGDRSQPLSALPGQRANSARPDPRRECPSGTAAWAYTRRPSVPTGRGSLKKPEQGHGPHPSPAGGGPIQALLRRYTRNPMPTPHGLKGGPLSGLSRPPRTRQLALYRITFCRRSEIRHTDRIWPAISYLLSKNSKYHIIWIVYFSFHTILGHKKQPIHKIEC